MKAEDVEKEATADKKRDEQIEAAKKIIPKIEDGNPTKADLLFQAQRAVLGKVALPVPQGDVVPSSISRRTLTRRRTAARRSLSPKKITASQSSTAARRCVCTRRSCASTRPTSAKTRWLFNLAYNQYDIGKKDLAIKRYEELLKSYPGSKFVSDTYVQLGNHYFEVANVLEKAKGLLREGVRFGRTRASRATRSTNSRGVTSTPASTRRRSRSSRTPSTSPRSRAKRSTRTDLKNEALNDSIRMFVQLNRADDAMAYFKAHAGKKKQISLTQKARLRPAGSRSSRQRDQVVPVPVERQRRRRETRPTGSSRSSSRTKGCVSATTCAPKSRSSQRPTARVRRGGGERLEERSAPQRLQRRPKKRCASA